jgi:hypothetical protein
MTQQRSALQDLFDRVLKSGKTETKFEGNETREGSYISGFKDQITTAALDIGGYVVHVGRTGYKLFSLAADTEGEHYTIEVRKGDEILLEATRQGASVTKNFGAEERHTGTDTTPEGEWVITKGKLPQELEVLPA